MYSKKKETTEMQSLSNKYIFGKHTLPHFYDPVTGIAHMKELYHQHRSLNQFREKALVTEIMQRKIAKVDFEDLREQELKEFMNLWNRVTVETDVVSLNDKSRIVEYIEKFMPLYANTAVSGLQTSTENRKQLWLSHLLNLY